MEQKTGIAEAAGDGSQKAKVLQLRALARVSAELPVAKYRRGMLAFCTMICNWPVVAERGDSARISAVHKAYGGFLFRYCLYP